jgi:hypothetical protein
LASLDIGEITVVYKPELLIGADLSLLIPVLNSSVFIPSIEYGHVVESAHIFSIGICYLYKFNL